MMDTFYVPDADVFAVVRKAGRVTEIKHSQVARMDHTSAVKRGTLISVSVTSRSSPNRSTGP